MVVGKDSMGELRNSSFITGEPLINYAPKCYDGLSFFVEEIFKKTGLVERRRVGIPFVVRTEFGDPVARFFRIDNRKNVGRIEKWSACVIQNAQVIRFNANDHIRLTESEIAKCSVPFL